MVHLFVALFDERGEGCCCCGLWSLSLLGFTTNLRRNPTQEKCTGLLPKAKVLKAESERRSVGVVQNTVQF